MFYLGDGACLCDRLAILLEIVDRPWVRSVGFIASICAAYDLLLPQLDQARKLAQPKFSQHFDGEDPISVTTQITREELKRFALTTIERPRFSFPGQRAGVPECGVQRIPLHS